MKLDLFTYGAYIQGEMNDNELHSHECIQISFSTESCSITIEDENITLSPGEAIVISQGIKHSIGSGVWINILVDNECRVGEDLARLTSDRPYVVVKDNKFIEKLVQNPEVWLSTINSNLRSEVKDAISLIKQHDHNCSLKEISNKVSLSSERFRKIFKTEVGITFKNYIRWQKIKTAFTLLNIKPNLKLVDIAYESGFTDQAHMTKTVRDTFGYVPKKIKDNL
jgi:AraC-like DNA-binding protein